MPRRKDLKKILVIGSGPIQIGQACEFDYSGTQALRALKAEGFELVLVNSNPATIMTDPELADRTYIEPLVVEVLERIIEKERPDAILPTLGGQVALNLTMDLHRLGVFDTYKVEVLGAKIASIELAENRERFRSLMAHLKIPLLKSEVVRTEARGLEVAREIGFPLILRPSFTLGGAGGGSVYNKDELSEKLSAALQASPTHEVLIEESIAGWKEIEFEIMADRKSQMVVVCHIENMDPMGVHTGDSITVAPCQTLTDKEIQRLREVSKRITKAVGIETGGCNIQFALDPQSDRFTVVEMNPRVSRSSALASKATGFPIAKIAALLAVGYSLEELQNDITQVTPASFEPALDYVVVKVPRFTFEKFQKTEPILGTQMKSVGEVMALGRSFPEALMKAFHSLESSGSGFELPPQWKTEEVGLESIRSPRFDRWALIFEILRQQKASIKDIAGVTGIDLWFLSQIELLIEEERKLKSVSWKDLTASDWRILKSKGFSDSQCARLWGRDEEEIRAHRLKLGVDSQLNTVDTCAGEFEARTPYYYFAYEEFLAAARPKLISKKDRKKAVVILGSGPNRIGQGVEFDYCCVKAVQAAQEAGFEAIMINCNPETVSTDYDVSTRLYFEPLEKEFVLRVLRHEAESVDIVGLICQTGGQTALKLSQQLKDYPLLGTTADQIDRAEDRKRFEALLKKLNLKRPEALTATKLESVKTQVAKIGYPVLIRPSYVLGGRAMHIVRSPESLERVCEEMALEKDIHFPILIDRFLEEAIEVDVDCVGDGKDFKVAAIMEHVEEAGIHSGDSSCSLPPVSLSPAREEEIQKMALRICAELQLCGFLNLQCALYKGEIYILEVNPRASRTLPFVCKATGRDWVKIGTAAILGQSFEAQGLKDYQYRSADIPHFSVKQVVFPFLKFPGVDVLLGPEMKSTGEVMSVGFDFNEAFVKSALAAHHQLPKTGTAFVSVRDRDKPKVLEICQRLKRLGFRIVATHGTAAFLREKGIVVQGINKVKEGQPHIVDAIINSQVNLVINTVEGEAAIADSFSIRRSALQSGLPYFTTLTAALAAVSSLDKWIRGDLSIFALQDYREGRWCAGAVPESPKNSLEARKELFMS